MTLNIKPGDLETAFIDVCEELGCENDNEAALQAVAALKDHIRQLEEALRFYAENSTLWSAMDKDDGKTARRALGESK